MTVDDAEHELRPGLLASVGASYLVAGEAGLRPFLLLSGSLGASATHTRLGNGAEVAFTALDLRLGGAAGYTFFERFSPYATARLFGGPVFWELQGASTLGTDRHHYAVGAGASLRLPAGLDLFAELLPLGERALTAGAGVAF